MTLRSILVPVDFSQVSSLAARAGVALARRIGADIRLLHVVELGDARQLDGEIRRRFEEAVMARSRDAMERLAIELDFEDLETEVVRGKVGATLLERAKSAEASLVVIGSSGRSAAEPLHLGSVAAALVRDAPCPVLVLRAGHGPRLPASGLFRRPVVAVDYSRFSEVALRCASVLSEPDAAIELFHALFVPRFEHFPSGDVDKMLTGAFELAKKGEHDRLAELGEAADIPGTVITTVVTGRAADRISDHLEGAGIDLVVTGAHGRQTSADLLIGSVADKLLRSSPVPVLFIPDAVANAR